jgi:calcium-dependent protein kinase
MPFYGSERHQARKICEGSYSMSSPAWKKVSEEAKSFIASLLEVDPSKRLTAAEALEHPWISRSHVHVSEGMTDVVRSLLNFGQLSQFQQHCMQMSAWFLPNEDHARVRDYFTSLDRSQQGVIKMSELKSRLVDQLNVLDEPTTTHSVKTFDCSHDQEICYSEFLAAMIGTKIELNDKILSRAYRRFDSNGKQALTKIGLRDTFGYYDRHIVDALFDKIDRSRNGYISLSDFVAFLIDSFTGTSTEDEEDIDTTTAKGLFPTFAARWPAFWGKLTLMLYTGCF